MDKLCGDFFSDMETGPPKEHALNSKWTVWFEHRNSRHYGAEAPDTRGALSQQQWEDCLQKVGHFNTLESFWSIYSHLKRPSALLAGSSYLVFRNDIPPTWENYPHGGHWILAMKKSVEKDSRLDRLWEQLLFALIGEEFEDPHVVGVVVKARVKEDVLCIWLSNKASKFRIGEKLQQVLHLGPSTVIEYKNNMSSIKDGTDSRNAQAYKIPDASSPDTEDQG